jgi:hypothetical protein
VNDLMIPASWGDVTADWMTAALAESHPGIEVESVELLLVDDGTNRRARFALTCRAGSGPETVFLKAADPDHAELNAATGGLFNEPRMFRTSVTLPIEHPAVHLALIDEPGLDFLLVMEDVVARGGDPRDATRPLTVDQAADGVRGLARLHSKFWGDRLTTYGEDLAWLEPLVAWRGMERGIEVGLERIADSVPTQVRDLSATEIEDCWIRYIATMDTETHTLLHGDPHVGNTYVLPDGRVGFLDWQVLHRGHHALDLGYFLHGALTPEDRREAEAGLVRSYLDALELPQGERPTFESTWLHYRASASHGLALWMATAASDTWQRPEVSLPLARLYAEAFVDLDTPSAVAELTDDRAR